MTILKILTLNVKNYIDFKSFGKETAFISERNLEISERMIKLSPDIFVLTEVNPERFEAARTKLEAHHFIIYYAKHNGSTKSCVLIGIKDTEKLRVTAHSEEFPSYPNKKLLLSHKKFNLLGLHCAASSVAEEFHKPLLRWIEKNNTNAEDFLVIGDFNLDTDYDDKYARDYFEEFKKMAEKYDAYHTVKPKNRPEERATFIAGTRIDRIFTNLAVESLEHDRKTFRGLTDHYAVIATLKIGL
ncbi:endonuclease/exonuclease/phosphatase family protein [Lactococcus kimchii]|uniref:endonuclease/exonuclease/phosphatase family protein n=1 Tax=Lactococcus sp. S-13 TaxID=2507158 RepID=UPI001023425D|nr:endonuclease/exonuclease/phosphatase family protein [Lactococcus sp. S-13]RZI49668.1 endonuclease/exonuclease/phosphatase family protein [Lactococcus sp. S-13]